MSGRPKEKKNNALFDNNLVIQRNFQNDNILKKKTIIRSKYSKFIFLFHFQTGAFNKVLLKSCEKTPCCEGVE